MAGEQRLGVAFIGAGSICEQRHLPGLAAFPNVELVSVCNRSPESSRRIAEKWGFRRAAENWRQVLADPDVDAVFIGTWPYMHRELSIAALESGKHVFCQARMCMDAREAAEMAAAAQTHPNLVSMICPSPHRVRWERTVKGFLSSGQLGELRSVGVVFTSGANCNPNQVTWRERIELSGLNILQVGIFAETLNAWLGEYKSLFASTHVLIPEKRDADGNAVAIKIPQVVSLAGTLAGGIPVSEFHSGLAAGCDQSKIALFGAKATCVVDLLDDRVLLNGSPIDDQGDEWQVERQFIDAVLAARRGESWRVSPDFPEAAQYMRKLQAIRDSAAESRAISVVESQAK